MGKLEILLGSAIILRELFVSFGFHPLGNHCTCGKVASKNSMSRAKMINLDLLHPHLSIQMHVGYCNRTHTHIGACIVELLANHDIPMAKYIKLGPALVSAENVIVILYIVEPSERQ